ncbi:PEP-CTERM sorting domain-containing protein, partial [Pseudomonadota bacterium]
HNLYDWARLEATAQVLSTPPPAVVPVPATLALILSGLLMFAFNRARTQSGSAMGDLTPINA